MTDEEIIEMANEYDPQLRYFPYRGDLIEFARLIAAKQRGVKCWYCGKSVADQHNPNECAAAIRIQK